MIKRRIFASLILLCTSSIAVMSQTADIRSIDFQNFSYRPSCGYDKETVRITEGQFVREEMREKLYFQVNGPAYGDLNGDGREEAVLTSICNTGGSGNFTEGFVFTMRGNTPVELARLPGGDRAFGGIVQARIENGLLEVERYAPAEKNGAACCPKYVETVRYRLSGRRLVQVGKPTKRLYKQ